MYKAKVIQVKGRGKRIRSFPSSQKCCWCGASMKAVDRFLKFGTLANITHNFRAIDLEWVELCPRCSDEMSGAVLAIKESAKKRRTHALRPKTA